MLLTNYYSLYSIIVIIICSANCLVSLNLISTTANAVKPAATLSEGLSLIVSHHWSSKCNTSGFD